MLNYTNGTLFQTLCKNALERKKTIGGYGNIQTLVRDEMTNLRKRITPLWGRTESDIRYYYYLEQLLAILLNCDENKGIEELAKKAKRETRSQIHALFLTQELSCWPSLESVYLAAQKNKAYHSTLVYTPFHHENFTNAADHYKTYTCGLGLQVCRHEEYELTKDSPDVVFLIKPYNSVPAKYQISQIQRLVPRLVYIPYGMENTTDLAKFGFQYFLHYAAWRHCAYGSVVKKFAKVLGYRNGENIALWGHPKADYCQKAIMCAGKIPKEWKEKLQNRRVFLWTPHHLINLDENGTGTWLLWGEKLLKLALERTDVAFVFRPHPLLMGALINNGVKSADGIRRMREQIENSPNILWDENPLYQNAFAVADAIITDATTFSIEFLYTKKPIMLTARNIDGLYLREQMEESYYLATTFEEIQRFVNMIVAYQDPLRERREKLYEEAFIVPEGITVGENIIKNVALDLKSECNSLQFIQG